jgi:hypothetical protein
LWRYQLSVISLGGIPVSVIQLDFDFGVAIPVEAAIHRASYRDGDRVFTGQVQHVGYQWIPPTV